MLKVKKTVKSNQYNNEADQWEDEVKNAIKQMYIKNKNDDKIFNEYEIAFKRIKNEYKTLYHECEEVKKENKELKKENEELKNEKKKFINKKSKINYEDEDKFKDDENIKYIVRKKRKSPKIIYEEEEEEEEDENEETDSENENVVSKKQRKLEKPIQRKYIRKKKV